MDEEVESPWLDPQIWVDYALFISVVPKNPTPGPTNIVQYHPYQRCIGTKKIIILSGESGFEFDAKCKTLDFRKFPFCKERVESIKKLSHSV